MRRRVTLASTIFLSTLALGADPGPTILPNGVRVVIEPDADAQAVAVLAIYDTGFIDDPSGLPQAAHLVEHLRCTAATASYEPGVSFDRLNAIGNASAETLFDLTYYDSIVPPEELGFALAVEAQRLASLRVEASDVAREGPRAAAEIDAVLASPMKFLGKFAQMAAVQAWYHGRSAVHLRTGLELTDHARLAALAGARHAPGALTLLVIGAVDEAAARREIDRHFADLPDAAPVERAPLDLPNAPPRVVWDIDARAVAIAAPDPEVPEARAAMALLGVQLMLLTRTTEGVASAIASGPTCPVGPSPFHVIAILRDDADPQRVAGALAEQIERVAAEPAPVRALAARLAATPRTLDPESIRQSAAIMTARGTHPARARTLLLANFTLQRVMRDRALPPDALVRIAAMDDAELSGLLTQAAAPKDLVVTVFGPAEQGP
jgi:predicted Zn-dependent peptidase